MGAKTRDKHELTILDRVRVDFPKGRLRQRISSSHWLYIISGHKGSWYNYRYVSRTTLFVWITKTSLQLSLENAVASRVFEE